jgi:hypothetical protein
MSDEHGKRFHQNISTVEKTYAGSLSQNMLADYSWNLPEEVSIDSYKRKSYRKKILNVS